VAILLGSLLGVALTPAQTRPRFRLVRRDFFAGKFLLIPRDTRPISLQTPRQLARVADHDLLVPPVALLGDAHQAADLTRLHAWLQQVDPADLDGAVFSLDMLVRGGAPINNANDAEARARLAVIKELRARRVGLPVCGFVSDDERLSRLGLEAVGAGLLDYLIIARDEQATGEEENRAWLNDEITRRKLTDQVAVLTGGDAAPQLLLARLLLKRFGMSPKIWLGTASTTAASAQITTLATQVARQIVAIDGRPLPGSVDVASSADLLFFLQLPGAIAAGSSSLLETISAAVTRGFRVTVADLSGESESRDVLYVELRRRKLIDPLFGFSAAASNGEAAAQALAQAVARLVTIKFLRDDGDRMLRAERAQIELTLTRLLTEFAYPTVVKPKLEAALRERWQADPRKIGAARAQAEAYAREEMMRLAEELFREQFQRNAHLIVLSSGVRASYELRALERMQLRFTWGTADQAEVIPGVYVVLANLLPPERKPPVAMWELEDNPRLDERLGRRFDSIDWGAYPTTADQVFISVNLNRGGTSPEGYTIQNRRKTRGVRQIDISASSARGAFYAFGRLEQLGADGRFDEDFQLTEAPAFAQRGVIEASSSPGQRDRIDLIRFLGRMRMNRYYYAPSDDALRRERWRDAYSTHDLDRFKDLLRAAEENFVDFVYVISPGASISYASESDIRALTLKLDSLFKAGVRYFTLAFDDGGLRAAADRERFKTLAAAQAQLVARVAEHLQKSGPPFELSVIPTENVEGDDGREYLRELGATLSRDVLIFWTRRDVFSSEYNEADARARGELLARRPIVWDNFPVVDREMWRLSFGPKRGGAPQLSDLTLGFIAMPTGQLHASMLPLATVADYAWDPRAYDPTKAQARALKMLYDERTASAIRKWIEITYHSRDSAALAPRLDELQESLELIGLARERGLLRGELSSLLWQTRRNLPK
jgi:hypothetical protein